MGEIYRKRGRVVRYENGRLVHVAEAGEAVEEGRAFRCAPLNEEVTLPEIESAEVEETVRRVRSAVARPLSIERLLVSEGVAEHEFGGERWVERSRRVHLSIAARALRILIDLGDFDLDATPIEAFARCGTERDAPPRVVLAPPVAAALLPALIGIAPPNVTLWQSAGGRDGKGREIDEARIAGPPWPNWYRPSYRARPIRIPHNVRIACGVTGIDDQLPRAVALLAPADGLVLRVLCADGKAVYPASIRLARIDAAAAPAKWYPFGAGSWGALLDVAT
jgi:hypothetical protein